MTTNRTTPNAARSIGATMLTAAATLALGAGLAACGGGHGKYTGKFKADREAAQSTLKSATSYDMAHQAFLAGDLDKAQTKVEESIAMNDQVAKSHVLRGRILLEKTDFGPAIQSLDRAIELDVANHEAHYFKGVIYERIARPEDALASFRQAAAIKPDDAQYAVAIAEVLIDMGRLGEARDFLTRDDSIFQHNAGVCQTLGHIAMIEGNAGHGVEMFEQARLLAPEDTAIMEDLVRAQMEVGRYAEAEYTLGRLLAMEGNETRRDLLHMRSRCLLEVDRPVEAREILLTLTGDELGQGDVEAWVSLGNVAYKLGDMARLRNASSRVVALSPDRYEGYLLRALWERRKGHGTRALKSLTQAVSLRGDEVSPLIVMGIVQRELGDFAGARKTLQQAWLEQPDNETVHQFIALIDEAEQTEVATHPGDQ